MRMKVKEYKTEDGDFLTVAGRGREVTVRDEYGGGLNVQISEDYHTVTFTYVSTDDYGNVVVTFEELKALAEFLNESP